MKIADLLAAAPDYLAAFEVTHAYKSRCSSVGAELEVFYGGYRPSLAIAYANGVPNGDAAARAAAAYARTAKIDNKFDDYFLANTLLRHPAMAPDLWAWSVMSYPLVGAELLHEALRRFNGSVFQNGAYTLTGDDADVALLNGCFGGSVCEWAKGELINAMLVDPNGYFGVSGREGARIEYHASTALTHAGDRFLVFEYNTAAVRRIVYYGSDGYAEAVYESGKFVESKSYKRLLDGVMPVARVPARFDTHGRPRVSLFNKGIEALKAITEEAMDYKLAKKRIAHPILTVAMPECIKCNGAGTTTIYKLDGSVCGSYQSGCTSEQSQCGACGGAGRMRLDPSGRFEVDAETLQGRDVPKMAAYVHPDVSVINAFADRYSAAVDAAREDLSLFVGATVQSGVAKELDMQARHLFVKEVDEAMYSTTNRLLSYAASFCGVNRAANYRLNKAVSYSIVTPDTLRAAYLDLAKSGADAMLVRGARRDYMQSSGVSAYDLRINELLDAVAPFRDLPLGAATEIMEANAAYSTEAAGSILGVTAVQGWLRAKPKGFDIINGEFGALVDDLRDYLARYALSDPLDGYNLNE